MKSLLRTSNMDTTEALVDTACCGDNKTISYLLKNKAVDIGRSDNLGWTALGIAIWRGYRDILAQLLAFDGLKAFGKGIDGASLLFYAAEGGYLDIIIQLLEFGLDINSLDNNGQTALFDAVKTGNLTTVQLLLDSGCQVGVIDKEGKTARDIALLNRFELIVNAIDTAEIVENSLY